MITITFDIDSYISKTLPTFMRKPVIKGFMRVLLISIGYLWQSADALYNAILGDLAITVQTDILQTHLRSLYPDVGSYKVFIKTQWDNIPQGYIQFIGEHQKTEYEKLLSEAAPTEYEWLLSERNLPFDYHVICPVAYAADLPDIQSIINRKKPAGKRVSILFQNITA